MAAKEHGLSSETARVTAQTIRPLLNALSGNIVLIDSKAQIFDANGSWRAFAETAGFTQAKEADLVSYIRFCELLISEKDRERAIEGIHDVLSGESDRFEMAHQGPAAEDEHWFRLIITGVEHIEGVRAVVAHDPIDELADAQAAGKFETLLSEMSAAFVRTDANQIDAEIEHWLRRIVLGLQIDRATVAQLNPQDGAFYPTHQWSRKGVPPIPLRINTTQSLPWLAKKVISGETVVLSDVHEAASEAPTDFEFAKSVAVRSNITVPLRVGGQIVGAVAFATVFRHRKWSPRIVERLTLVAEVFGNAIERMRADTEFRRLQNELVRMSRVITMGELTASLAHELNQPLGAILNNAQAARRFLSAKKPDAKEVQAALDEIIRDDARAVEIVANVRALFKPGESKRSLIDLKQVVFDVEKVLRADAMKKGISLRLTLPDQLPAVFAERTPLIQAMINLVINAFDSISETSAGSREVGVRVWQTDPSYVRVAVQDTGKGIDPSIASRLFDPFVTTKTKGLGMGLAIVRSIINRHDGQLRAVSNRDRGATFEFTLPIQSNQ